MSPSTRPVLGPVPSDLFYRQLIDELNDGVYFVNLESRISYWSRGAERITGYSREEVVGCYCRDTPLRHVDGKGEPLCGARCLLRATTGDGERRQAEVFIQHKGGHRVPVRVKAAPIRSEGRIVGAVEIFTDESSRVESIRRVGELENLALLDPLTGVGNRRYCEQVVEQRLTEFHRHGLPIAVLFLDIDRFKAVNDLHGHETGDAVLRTVARTLMHTTRAGDFIGRWGGEEFLVVSVQSSHEGARVAAERMRAAIGSSDVLGPSGTLSVSVSVGATMARPDDDVSSLIRRADALMYASKGSGRNCVSVDAPEPPGTSWSLPTR